MKKPVPLIYEDKNTYILQRLDWKLKKKMEQENHKHIILTGKEEVFIQLLKRSQY